MHCPYCGVVLEEAQRVWFVFYKAGMAKPGAIITCEQEGERHHVELLTPGPDEVRFRKVGCGDLQAPPAEPGEACLPSLRVRT